MAYGCEVDVYSVALILYEMFSGKLAFENMDPHQLLLAVALKKRRPDIDDRFPKELRTKIEAGWSHEPAQRCSLDEFLNVLLRMKSPTKASAENRPSPAVQVSIVQQAAHVQTESLADSPMTEMKWTIENKAVLPLIQTMIAEMQKASSFQKALSERIINAMLQIPKDLFVDKTMVKSTFKIDTDDEYLKRVYNFRQAMKISPTQNMSSTEIIAAQLSLIPLNSGDRVLFLGAKGGYIQVIAGQIVGFQGQVWICSEDAAGLEHVQNVLKHHVPPILRQIIQCVHVQKISDLTELKQKFENYFNAIHICGAIAEKSLDTFQSFLKVDGQLLAPVNIDDATQRFLILHKTRDRQTGDIKLEKRILHDWGVIFGPVC